VQRDRRQVDHDLGNVRLCDVKLGLGRAIGDHVRDSLIVVADRIFDEPGRGTERLHLGRPDQRRRLFRGLRSHR